MRYLKDESNRLATYENHNAGLLQVPGARHQLLPHGVIRESLQDLSKESHQYMIF
jgi:hypothetical protein